MALLATRSPKLRKALREAKKAGHAYVVIDGTLIPIDRVAADQPFYSGKHRRHGMNLQVIASPDGGILWVSGQWNSSGIEKEPITKSYKLGCARFPGLTTHRRRDAG